MLYTNFQAKLNGSRLALFLLHIMDIYYQALAKLMKSDPRQNWCFESSSRYSGLPRCLPSSSRRLPRSSRRELLLFVSPRPSSSRRLPRSGRRPSVRLVAAEFVSSTPQIESSFFCSTRGCRVRLVDSPDRVVVLLFDSWLLSSTRRPPRSTRREI